MVIHMNAIECIHYMLGARFPHSIEYPRHAEYSNSLSRTFGLLICIVYVTNTIVIESIRFLAISLVIIPVLACIFVCLGIVFHLPRMLAAYACRLLINIFMWHQSFRVLDSSRRSNGRGTAYCNGSCCLTCRAGAYMMSKGELFTRHTYFCCKCLKCVNCHESLH
jgi:hypothetical protein